MALTGTYQDHYKDMYKSQIHHQSQQEGSRLLPAVQVETMEGNKTFFDKLGSVTAGPKNSRNEDRTSQDITFERRQVQGSSLEFYHEFDREDLIKYVSNPQNAVTQAAVWELGVKKDAVIMSAISGNAVVTANGSTSNTALTLSVAVNDHSFDSGSGDVGLTTSKLKAAKTLIMEGYGSSANRRLICIAPERQIMNLTTEDQQVSGDYRAKKPLEGPGMVRGLSGFMGIDFISYEETGLSGTDETAYLITDDAVKLGIFIPLTVDVFKVVTRKLSPDGLAVFENVGATRMYEEKVCQIICDPVAFV
jgi:hypothetical protein